MTDRRKKDRDWAVASEDGTMPTWERIGIAVMMDLRDELKRLNTLLHCPNFTGIPHRLRLIERAIKDKKPRPRICGKCHGPIVLHDKWRTGERGRQHLDCKNPTTYPKRKP